MGAALFFLKNTIFSLQAIRKKLFLTLNDNFTKHVIFATISCIDISFIFF